MLFTWPLQSEQDLMAGLEHLPRVDPSGLDFSWTTAARILFVCIAASWWMLGGRGVWVVSTLRSMRSTVSGWLWHSTGSSLEQGLLNSEHDRRDEDRHRPSVGDYRKEFLWLGFWHGLLAFLREILIRDGLPHTWGIVPSRVATEFGIEQLRKFLAKNEYYSGNQGTVLDQPFMGYEWCLSLSLTLQALLLLLIFASAVCEQHGWKDRSQTCAFAAAAVAMMSALSTFVPNYVQLTHLPQAFSGCGTRFDNQIHGVWCAGDDVWCIARHTSIWGPLRDSRICRSRCLACNDAN